jgi:hypothetical protein
LTGLCHQLNFSSTQRGCLTSKLYWILLFFFFIFFKCKFCTLKVKLVRCKTKVSHRRQARNCEFTHTILYLHKTCRCGENCLTVRHTHKHAYAQAFKQKTWWLPDICTFILFLRTYNRLKYKNRGTNIALEFIFKNIGSSARAGNSS